MTGKEGFREDQKGIRGWNERTENNESVDLEPTLQEQFMVIGTLPIFKIRGKAEYISYLETVLYKKMFLYPLDMFSKGKTYYLA